ncbi:MAG: hypothetical protein Q4B54_11370, partial [Coriobacteriales bacterium]|nr:hypothetical protein [Coriobacteriales bacterium]
MTVTDNVQTKVEDVSANSAGKDKSATLEKRLKSVDGHSYTVRVSFSGDAGVPEGAELSVVELNQLPADWGDEQKQAEAYKDRPYATEELLGSDEMAQHTGELLSALELGQDAQAMWSKLLRVEIVKDDAVVLPQSEVKVEIVTDAVKSQSSDTLEVALVRKSTNENSGSEELVAEKSDGQTAEKLDVKNKTAAEVAKAKVKAAEEAKASRETKAVGSSADAESGAALVATSESAASGSAEKKSSAKGVEKSSVKSTTAAAATANSSVSFTTRELGEIGLAQVVEKKFEWQLYGQTVGVWGARSVEVKPSEKQYGQELVEDLSLIQAFFVRTSS